MISHADVVDLLWDETERRQSGAQDTLPREIEDTFVALFPRVPQVGVLLYRPRHGLDSYVRAWAADSDATKARWAAALHLRLGLVTGNPVGWAAIGRRLGVSRQVAQRYAAKALADYWRAFEGRGGENIHKLREEATDWLAEDGHGGSQGKLPPDVIPPRDPMGWNPQDVGANQYGIVQNHAD